MKSLEHLGSWLNRKWVDCQQRKFKAQGELDELHIGVDILRKEWAAQIKEQTKPLIRRSANLANKIIEEVLALQSTLHSYKADIEKFEQMLETGQYNAGMDANETTIYLQELHVKCGHIQGVIGHKKATLDVDGRLSLLRLLNNKFLQKRVNALALKKRIRSRLCQRKFELDGLERVYKHTSNSM
jgi:hypothetical protein